MANHSTLVALMNGQSSLVLEFLRTSLNGVNPASIRCGVSGATRKNIRIRIRQPDRRKYSDSLCGVTGKQNHIAFLNTVSL